MGQELSPSFLAGKARRTMCRAFFYSCFFGVHVNMNRCEAREGQRMRRTDSTANELDGPRNKADVVF